METEFDQLRSEVRRECVELIVQVQGHIERDPGDKLKAMRREVSWHREAILKTFNVGCSEEFQDNGPLEEPVIAAFVLEVLDL